MLLKLQPVILLSLAGREASALSLGQFNVSHATSFLTDHSRLDPFSNSSQPRQVAISTFTPASNSCTTYSETPYMPPATASFEGVKFAAAYGLPDTFFTYLTLSVASCNTTTERDSQGPTVLFSPALGTSRHFYTLLAATLAATHNYTVITVDHPFDVDVVERPNGSLVHGLDIPDAQIPQALDRRAGDLRFVLDTLNAATPRTVSCGKAAAKAKAQVEALALGHSLGGAAALLAAAEDRRFRSAVNIDGSVVVGNVVSNISVAQPALFLAHEGKNLTTDPTWEAVWPKLTGYKGLLNLEGSQHYTFSDLPALLAVLGDEVTSSPEIEGMLGTIGAEEAREATVGVVGSFFEMVMGEIDADGFKEAVESYDEIKTIL